MTNKINSAVFNSKYQYIPQNNISFGSCVAMKTNGHGKLLRETDLSRKQERMWITKLVNYLKAGDFEYKGMCKDGLGLEKDVFLKKSNHGVIVFIKRDYADGLPKITYSPGKTTSYTFKQDSEEDFFLYKSFTSLLEKTIYNHIYKSKPYKLGFDNSLPFVASKQISEAH